MSAVTHKNLDAFVHHSIKAINNCPDEAGLQTVLDRMTIAELQSFWMRFSANRAYSVATSAVPDWKTKQQGGRLGHEILNYAFYPKEKDVEGKYIVVRSDLEEHIKKHLLKHISYERRTEQLYQMRPLFDRIHSRIGMSVVLLLWLSMALGFCLFILSGVFHFSFPSWLFNAGAGTLIVLFILYAFVMPFLRLILGKCNLLKDKSHDD